MAINDGKEGGDAEAVETLDPEAARKAERAARLEGLMRDFGARMAARVDKPPEPEITAAPSGAPSAEDFAPRVFLEPDRRAFLNEAQK